MSTFNFGPPKTPAQDINYRIVQPVAGGAVEVYWTATGNDIFIGQADTFEQAMKIASDHAK